MYDATFACLAGSQKIYTRVVICGRRRWSSRYAADASWSVARFGRCVMAVRVEVLAIDSEPTPAVAPKVRHYSAQPSAN